MASLRPEKDILSLQSKLEETWNGANVLAALNEKVICRAPAPPRFHAVGSLVHISVWLPRCDVMIGNAAQRSIGH